jgi:hypothetical protein
VPPIVLESLLTAMWLLFLTILLLIVIVQAVVFVRFLLVATVALQVYVEGKGEERFYWWPLRHRDRAHPGDRPKRADEHVSGRPARTAPAERPGPTAAPRARDERPVAPAPTPAAAPAAAPATAVAVDRHTEPEPATTPAPASTDAGAEAPSRAPKSARESRTSSLLSRGVPSRAEGSRPERAPRTPRRPAPERPEEGESDTDREAAMNRLFAPLSETDSTEPLSRPKRSPSRSTPEE